MRGSRTIKNNASNLVKKTYKGGYQPLQSNTSTLARFLYGRTSRKRPPRTQKGFSGHLREVVAYKNRATGVLFGEDRSTFWKRLWYMHFLSIQYVQPHVLAERSSCTMSSVVHKAIHGDQTMRQVVVYKRFKTVTTINP